jgi:hypothetical protein
VPGVKEWKRGFAVNARHKALMTYPGLYQGTCKGLYRWLTWIKRKENIEEVEKRVDIAVAIRLKKRGMSWYKDGANPLLKLKKGEILDAYTPRKYLTISCFVY